MKAKLLRKARIEAAKYYKIGARNHKLHYMKFVGLDYSANWVEIPAEDWKKEYYNFVLKLATDMFGVKKWHKS